MLTSISPPPLSLQALASQGTLSASHYPTFPSTSDLPLGLSDYLFVDQNRTSTASTSDLHATRDLTQADRSVAALGVSIRTANSSFLPLDHSRSVPKQNTVCGVTRLLAQVPIDTDKPNIAYRRRHTEPPLTHGTLACVLGPARGHLLIADIALPATLCYTRRNHESSQEQQDRYQCPCPRLLEDIR